MNLASATPGAGGLRACHYLGGQMPLQGVNREIKIVALSRPSGRIQICYFDAS